MNDTPVDAPSGTQLLTPELLRSLRRLRLLVRRATGSMGTHRARRRGASAEFAEHRAYAPGDDIRRIDWNVYARLEELVIRLFVAEDELSLHLLIDTSASMGVGERPKLALARRLAAALGYLALHGHERVTVVPLAEPGGRTPAYRGSKRVPSLFASLAGLAPAGPMSLERSVERFVASGARPGLVVLISDLLDPAGFERPIDRLRAARHDVAIFHLVADDLALDEGGDLTLVDSETGALVEVSLDADTVRAYRARRASFLAEVAAHARRRGCFHLPIDEGDLEALVEEAVLSFVGHQRDAVHRRGRP